jgi:ketosteroid isomerase-like protein
VAARLQQAINAHDLEAVVALFAEDYRNETPAHPARGFSGAEQVRRNWTRILGSAPDLRADLVRSTTDGDVEWSEWSWAGTGLDGRPLQMAGVVVLGIVRGRAQWARFYLEPVDRGSDGVGAAVGRFVHEGSPEDRR